MNKITNIIFHGETFKVKASVRIKDKTGKTDYGVMFSADGYVHLVYNPTKSIIIEAEREQVVIRINDYEEIVEALKYMHGLLHDEEDLYYTDNLGDLILNKELAKKYTVKFISYDMSLVIRHAIVTRGTTKHEGVELLINNKIAAPVHHKELKKLYKTLNRLDIYNYLATLALTSHVMEFNEKKIRLLEFDKKQEG